MYTVSILHPNLLHWMYISIHMSHFIITLPDYTILYCLFTVLIFLLNLCCCYASSLYTIPTFSTHTYYFPIYPFVCHILYHLSSTVCSMFNICCCILGILLVCYSLLLFSYLLLIYFITTLPPKLYYFNIFS